MKSADLKQLPQVKSPAKTIAFQLTIVLGCINIGYVLSYLTQTIDTLFANLHIDEEEKTSKLSLVNGILPLGCFFGVFFAYFMQKKLTNKQCIFLADILGMLSLLTLIAEYEVIVTFRFMLGFANGISSYFMPIYLKSLCPERYYVALSLFIGYWTNVGLLLGQVMGAGYITYHGEGTSWWRVVFIIPSVVCATRSLIIRFYFNYDSPEQLIQQGKLDDARNIIKQIYKDEFIDEVYTVYAQKADMNTQDSLRFLDIFKRKKFVTLQIGVVSMFIQMWCGSSAIFYYSSQIFNTISGGDITEKTIYQICIGLFSAISQFSTLYFIKTIGNKYLLIIGGVLLGLDNFAIGILSSYSDSSILFSIFILMVFLICVFSCTIGPITWSMVPQVNDKNATFVSVECRWMFQTLLVFLFPYMVRGLNINGVFYLFGALDLTYVLYTMTYVIDSRGMTSAELVEKYQIKYSKLEQVKS